jgi:uncharacterized protein YcfJ
MLAQGVRFSNETHIFSGSLHTRLRDFSRSVQNVCRDSTVTRRRPAANQA